MKAILLAAGYGRRLRPLTLDTPKCLIPINGKPLLEIWLEKLSKLKIGPFLVNTHYLHKKVENFIYNCPYKEDVSLVYEPKLLGTAGTIRQNLEFANCNDCFLIHSDNYVLDDLKEFIKAHNARPKECLITMMIFRVQEPKKAGIVVVDNNIVTEFYEKKDVDKGNLANGAIYLLSEEFLKHYQFNYSHCKDFSTEIIPSLLGKIYTYETKSKFLDIGSIDSLRLADNSY